MCPSHGGPPPELQATSARRRPDTPLKYSLITFLARHRLGWSQHGRGGFCKFPGVNRNAGMEFIYLIGRLTVSPRHDPAERTFDSVHIAVIRVIDLNRICTDGCGGVPQLPAQQAGLFIKKQLHAGLAGAHAFDRLDIAVPDGGDRETRTPLTQRLFNLRWEQQLRLQTRAVEFCARREREKWNRIAARRHPPSAAVVNRGAIAVLGVNHSRHLRWSFGVQLE